MNYHMQKELGEQAVYLSQRIATAGCGSEFGKEPFKHLVLDNAFNLSYLENARQSFPLPCDPSWENTNDDDIEIKQRSNWSSEFDIPDGLIDIFRILNSAPMLRALSAVFSIPKLIPDPYYTGGGLNQMSRGGHLGVHVDGNYHDATGLTRRLNVILFIHPEWKNEWFGHFGLFGENGTTCIKEVAPIPNRLIAFETHDKSFHGFNSPPINCPEEVRRQSILLYYYTHEPRSRNQVVVEDPHSALWVDRGMRDKRGCLTRDYE